MVDETDFALTIELGNAAMLTSADVAAALRVVAGKLDAGHDAGGIYDLNGNKVGRFIGNFADMTEEETEEETDADDSE